MHLAVQEARRGGKAVRPNPRVGAAAWLPNGCILAARHEVYGGAHAEMKLLAKAAELGLSLRGARVAVTLEPCSHVGKTGPCADALIAAQIQSLLIGGQDPFPEVAGRGLARVRAANIPVEVGVLAKECFDLNRAWLTAQAQRKPFVRLKMATSLDGRWTSADGISKWITGSAARAGGHALRREADAIVTSLATIDADNPELSARRRDQSRYPEQPQLFIVSREASNAARIEGKRVAAHPNGVRWLAGTGTLGEKLQNLFEEGLFDVLVEGGPRLAHAVLEAGVVNEVHLFMAPQFLGGAGLGLPPFGGGKLPGCELVIRKIETLLDGNLHLVLDAKPPTLT